MADVMRPGELLIDFTPALTGIDLEAVPAFTKLPGAAPVNVVVGLRRLGARSVFMSKVGDDAIRVAKLVHFGSLSLRAMPVPEATLLALEAAREAECLISHDSDLILSLWAGEEVDVPGPEKTGQPVTICKCYRRTDCNRIRSDTGPGRFATGTKVSRRKQLVIQSKHT